MQHDRIGFPIARRTRRTLVAGVRAPGLSIAGDDESVDAEDDPVEAEDGPVAVGVDEPATHRRATVRSSG
ncbi:MAG: hypothetical protein ABEJ40_00695 [Haloarculaceae archaeon]